MLIWPRRRIILGIEQGTAGPIAKDCPIRHVEISQECDCELLTVYLPT